MMERTKHFTSSEVTEATCKVLSWTLYPNVGLKKVIWLIAESWLKAAKNILDVNIQLLIWSTKHNDS